ncbi:MAG TPA: hypothetical protein VH081_09735 [Solirubrobacteraceae bacterium]|jgi:hypothetical protein|nr:hypothetical protein [Solirubrobacteraceae bacterium]
MLRISAVTRAIAAIALFSLVLGIPAAANARAASGTWSAPQNLGGESYFDPGSSTAPDLVSNAAGDEALVWTSPAGLRLSIARRGGPFAPSRPVASGEPGDSIVAIDDRGDVAVAWSLNDHSITIPVPGDFDYAEYCCEHLVVATLAAGAHRFRYQQMTTPRRSLQPSSLALAANGSTLAVLYYDSPPVNSARPRELFARLGRFGHRLGRAVVLGSELNVFSMRASTGHASLLLDSAVEGDGLRDALVTQGARLAAERRVPGFFGYPLEGQSEGYDARGDFAMLASASIPTGIAWNFGTRRAGGRFRVQRLASDKSLSESERILNPAIAVSAGGETLASWIGPGLGTEVPHSLIVASARLPRGRLVQQAKIVPTPFGLGYRTTAAAIDDRGQGVIVADQADPAAAYQEGGPLVALFRSPAGRLSQPALIGRIEDVAQSQAPAVVIDAHGRGVAVWQDGRGELLARRFRSSRAPT